MLLYKRTSYLLIVFHQLLIILNQYHEQQGTCTCILRKTHPDLQTAHTCTCTMYIQHVFASTCCCNMHLTFLKQRPYLVQHCKKLIRVNGSSISIC